jgi:hypothetical protein
MGSQQYASELHLLVGRHIGITGHAIDLKLVIGIRCMCGPSSSVGIATGYGMDGLGIESQWR